MDTDLVLRMSRQEYRDWADTQPDGRFELIGGEVVRMPPERWVHQRLKANVFMAFHDALIRQGLPYRAMTDGMTIEVGDDTDFIPDASIARGLDFPDTMIAAPEPVVVVEVLSPSTASRDRGRKLHDYFRVPTIAHYLVVKPDPAEIAHHARDGSNWNSRVFTDGDIRLDPPGITLAIADVFRR